MKTKKEVIEQLKKDGFSGFKTIAELEKGINTIPNECGVYILLRPNDSKPIFLEKGTGGSYKGRNPNVEISKLEAKWLENTPILYIGKADKDKSSKRGVRTRLDEYLQFGRGTTIGHWGGRYIWQLKDASELIVCWKHVDGSAEQEEKQMLKAFKAKYGKYPFANLRL